MLWAHYSDMHTGFALRYRIKDITIDECNECQFTDVCYRPYKPFYPVVYKDKRFDATIYSAAHIYYKKHKLYEQESYPFKHEPIPLLTLLQKGKDWEYEKEWRIICRNKEKVKFHIEADALYLGCKMPEDERKEKIIKEAQSKNMEIFEMKLNVFYPEFKLETFPLIRDQISFD